MGRFEFSTMLAVLWNHPLLCGSVLLLLTPSLFHILLYFSPLLISTALFIAALISMGPRMEETQQEREKWAKGEKPIIDSSDNWPYTDWMPQQQQPDAEPVIAARKQDGSTSWLEEGKGKLAVWIDNMFKAGDPKPLVHEPASAAASVDEKKMPVSQTEPPAPFKLEEPVAVVLPQAVKVEEIEAVEDDSPEEIKTVEVDATSAVKPPAPPVPAEEDVKFTTVEKELDMPELEVVEVPQSELVTSSEKVAAEVLLSGMPPDDQPIWDEPRGYSVEAPAGGDLPLTDDDLMDVSLNDPVQETVHEELLVNKLVSSKVTEQEYFATATATAIAGGGSTTKHVHFSASPPPAPSSREVHKEILKNLHTQLNELQSKRRNKYTQILSRRMSSKNGTWQ